MGGSSNRPTFSLVLRATKQLLYTEDVPSWEPSCRRSIPQSLTLADFRLNFHRLEPSPIRASAGADWSVFARSILDAYASDPAGWLASQHHRF